MNDAPPRCVSYALVGAFTLLTIGAVCLAGGGMHQEVKATRPYGKRMLFVVDVSGSMRGGSFERALSAVRRISEQPVDEMEVAWIAFRDTTHRWPATGWVKLPDATQTTAANAWLTQLCAAGNTKAIPALRRASAEGADVVFVTDGIFQMESDEDVLAAWTGPGVFGCYGVGRSRSELLARLGRKGGGGYWRETPPTGPPAWPRMPPW